MSLCFSPHAAFAHSLCEQIVVASRLAAHTWNRPSITCIVREVYDRFLSSALDTISTKFRSGDKCIINSDLLWMARRVYVVECFHIRGFHISVAAGVVAVPDLLLGPYIGKHDT